MSAAVIREESAGAGLEIAGVKVSPVDMDEAVATIERWIETRDRNYVCIRDAHGIVRCQTDDDLREIHRKAGLVTPDGMPVVWMARQLGYPQTQRVYGPDLMRTLTALSATRGYRQYYYGGNEGVADQLKDVLTAEHPGLNVAGTYCPPFRPLTDEEDDEIVAKINAAKPDIVWVGLSTPKQEYWMASHVHRLEAPVLIGVGAAFDFLSGNKAQAPRWIQRSGFEWLYRLATEPGRLGRRYMWIIPNFIYLAGAQLLKARKDEQAALGGTTT